MKKKDFDFELPEQLIAQYPVKNRCDSKLLKVDGQLGEIQHLNFPDIINLLEAGDLLVFNNTRVIPARLYGQKESGGKVEVLIERLLAPNKALTKIRASKSPKPGSKLLLGTDHASLAGFEVLVTDREDDLFIIEVSNNKLMPLLESYGHIPLPPYVKREDNENDHERYQTVYASESGAVAAPTAGLHFDHHILETLKQKGVLQAFVTLHVGAGTYQPVRADNITDHKMHSETIKIDKEVIQLIKKTREQDKRVIAVGTTSLRTLESAATFSHPDPIAAYEGETDIFIYPGYQFKIVDALITNFHLPESTLFMLVSAFSGLETMKKAYTCAIDKRYRFFSYGDAMFLTPQGKR